jgi:hypothetical protein
MEDQMVISRNARRARAIAISLMITFATNYAITYAAKPVGSSNDSKATEVTSQSSARSGLGAGNTKPAPPPPSRTSN